jgi:predicted dehydrogenase
MSVGVGIVGSDGHQLTDAETRAAGGRIVGTVGVARHGVPTHATIAELLRDPAVDLVSVCLTPRDRQAEIAMAALEAGRHVLIERPATTSRDLLDRLEATAARTGRILCERVTTPFDAPFRLARELLAGGAVGTIVQVSVHKAYPYASWRPQDERVQGGLLLQTAAYALDAVRLVAGAEPDSLHVVDTTLGNPEHGELRMAAGIVATLRGGGIATIAASYLNPPDSGVWTRDELLVAGTAGILRTGSTWRDVEVATTVDTRRHEVRPAATLLEELLRAIRDGSALAVEPAELLGSTRWLLRTERTSWTEGRWR